MTEPSLRERTRARRHAAIEEAAMRLFAERGYDATTLAQVGEAAEVAPRTVSMYFPSKLHLALSYSTVATQRLAEAIAARPAGAPALDVLMDWVRTEFDVHGESIRLHAAMLRANLEIRGAETPELTLAKQSITEALADDLGRSHDDIVVRLLGGAFTGVVDALIQADLDEEAAGPAFAAAIKLLQAALGAAK